MKSMFWRFVRSILFCGDAESVHRLMIQGIRWGIRIKEWFGFSPLRWVSGEKVIRLDSRSGDPLVFGMPFRSRLGLAAGFDKNAEILKGLPDLGFGFVEVGTVTPRPQSGNLRPRLFRDQEREAIFNRMGFNGEGAQAVAKRISKVKAQLPRHFRIGVNLGKNKDTRLEDAAKDYLAAVKFFAGLADYLVINVSSPNTPGLRSLQTTEALKPIVGGVVDEIVSWKVRPPLLLKMAPEISRLEWKVLIPSLENMGIDGWVLTNTLGGAYSLMGESLLGGWSGRPLALLSNQALTEVSQFTQKPIISVGGISSVEEGVQRLARGASLVQIYTGWIYQGPRFPVMLSQTLRSTKALGV